MVPAERLPKNKKAEQPYAQGNPAINMNRFVFPSPFYNGATANRQIHGKISLIKCKLFIYTKEKSHKSIQKYHSL
jgi:hypothetical protein